MPRLSQYLVCKPGLIRLLALCGWLLVSLWPIPCPAQNAPDGQTAQRAAFKRAWQLAAQGDPAWRAQAARLEHYSIYPYLEAEALQQGLQQLELAAVERYLKRYPNWLPARDLRQAVLLELARRQDWANFTRLYQPGLGFALQCNALQARLAQDESLDFQRDLAALWQQPRLPSTCDPVLVAARRQGLLSPQRISQRLGRAIAAGASDTVVSLASQLPPGREATEAKQWAQALRNPAEAVAAASSWADTPGSRTAVAHALTKLAQRDSKSAEAAWPGLSARFNFDAEQRRQLEAALALYAAADFMPGALDQLAALPTATQTTATREWRVRLALSQQDWPAVLAAIAALPPAQQAQSEWRYFKARALEALGNPEQARALYGELAGKTDYFGFLAADRLHQAYALCPSSATSDPAAEAALLSESAGLQRAFELFAVGLPRLARREWTRALRGAPASQQQLAAQLAYQRGWYEQPIRVFSHGPGLHYYAERFPLDMDKSPNASAIAAQAEQAGIDPAWAYAIIRIESAFATDARSRAGARGLMQLLPAVAQELAQRQGLPWSGAQSLDNPTLNVTLGTRYLAQLASRYQGAPWLASAAYNAGPQNLARWLAARKNLPPDVFVATIPYKETRSYVTHVMTYAVIYDWRLHRAAAALYSRMPPVGTPYGAASHRQPLSCPRITPAPAPSSATVAAKEDTNA